MAYWRQVCVLNNVNILVVDDDSASQHALQHVFDTEGWRVSFVPMAKEALRELARGVWTLVVANVALADVRGPLFAILRELAQTEPGVSKKMLRVLFMVPGGAAQWAQPVLEREGLPYTMKPLHLHDFLAKVSDLLLETGAIGQPIRDARLPMIRERKIGEREKVCGRPHGQMFASREDYMMTEEEIAEFEAQEERERKRRLEDQKRREFF
jgi:DNA-binding response OmpR family regulator